MGYAATPGLKRGARGAYTRAGTRGFIGRGAVQKTGAKVIGGAAALGTGAAGAKAVSNKNKKRKAAAAKQTTKPATKTGSKSGKAPIKFSKKGGSTTNKKNKSYEDYGFKATATFTNDLKTEKRNKGTAAKTFAAAAARKKALKKAVKKAAPRGASSAGSRFDKMTTAQKNRLTGKDAAAYRKYLKSKKK